MTFDRPSVLALLALLLPLALGWAVREDRRRRATLGAFGDARLLGHASALPDRWRQSARDGARVAALALALVALAGPQLGLAPNALARNGRDVLVVLDLSRSMNAVDVEPSRLAEAKRLALRVVGASPGDRVGLIVFGGSAFLQLPLTPNRAAFHRFLDAASVADLGDPTTSLPAALATAVAAFRHAGAPGHRAALVVSDGETMSDHLAPPIAELRKEEIPVFAVGVGTVEGGRIPADSAQAPDRWHRDHTGREVVTRLVDEHLRRVARETGGAYARASDDAAVHALARALAGVATRPMNARRDTEPAERFQWPLALAVAALALEPAVGRTRRRR
jgi:Ca-activated chloride channel family protein